jgi:hypothetical protein
MGGCARVRPGGCVAAGVGGVARSIAPAGGVVVHEAGAWPPSGFGDQIPLVQGKVWPQVHENVRRGATESSRLQRAAQCVEAGVGRRGECGEGPRRDAGEQGDHPHDLAAADSLDL